MQSGETPQIESIVETVVSILKEADFQEATEQKVRTMAADRLGIDPYELGYKCIVRRCVESYLLSLVEEEDKVEELHQGVKQDKGRVICKKPDTLEEEKDKVEQHKRLKQDGGQFICKLSGKRSLSVHNFRGKVFVSFRDYYPKNGKLLPSARGISLSTEQWSAFRKSVPDIQVAITKMESLIRSKDVRMETDMSNSAAALASGLIPMEMKESENAICNHAAASVTQGDIPRETKQIEAYAYKANQFEAYAYKAKTKQLEADISLTETTSAPHRMASMETKQIEADKSNSVIPATNGAIPMETKQTEASNAPITTQIETYASNSATTSAIEGLGPLGAKRIETHISNAVSAFAPLVPIKTIRLDGKNYYCWVHQMEILLKRLKIAYVLTDQCPSIPDRQKASLDEITRAKTEVRKWVEDDYLCHHSILNCLSDHLFEPYSKKTMSAKELWEELKSAYDKDFGTKISEVNKYIQFQMVDGISVLEQVHELCRIANSIVASGMWIDVNFHASAIISKLPPSWKEYREKLMREESTTLTMLMHRLRVEEEFRNHAQEEEFSHAGELWEDNKLGPKKRGFKRFQGEAKRGE